MEELEISDLWNIFVDNLKVIFLTTVLFMVLSVTYTKLIVTPMYESSTKIILVNSKDENKEEITTELTSSDIALNQKLVSTYSEIIKSRKVVDRVIKNLGLEDTKYKELSENITVSPVEDSEVINISVKDKNKNIATAVANTLVTEFSKEVKEIYKIENVKQVDKAIPAEEPFNVNLVKNIIIFAAIGFILSYGIAFLVEYFKTTVSTPDEIEKITGATILGIVPDLDVKEK